MIRFKQLNNKGLSLVELIVAISIGVIISGSVAALIAFSLRMYNNENVNTAMQYELQTNLNMMMDEIMSASAFAIKQNDAAPGATLTTDTTGTPYTKYAMFGNPNYVIKDGVDEHGLDVYKRYFKGVIFVSSPPDAEGKFKVYMKEVQKEYALNVTVPLQDLAETEYDAVDDYFPTTTPAPGATPVVSPYLLGENVTQFVIYPSNLDETGKTYSNPVELQVELRFEKNGWGEKEYEKHVRDHVYMRNKATVSLFVTDPNDTGKSGEFKLKKK